MLALRVNHADGEWHDYWTTDYRYAARASHQLESYPLRRARFGIVYKRRGTPAALAMRPLRGPVKSCRAPWCRTPVDARTLRT